MADNKYVLYGLITGAMKSENQYFIIPESMDDGRVFVSRIGGISEELMQRINDGEKISDLMDEDEFAGLPFQVIAGEETDAPDTFPRREDQ